jgi:hypothetical protein
VHEEVRAGACPPRHDGRGQVEAEDDHAADALTFARSRASTPWRDRNDSKAPPLFSVCMISARKAGEPWLRKCLVPWATRSTRELAPY